MFAILHSYLPKFDTFNGLCLHVTSFTMHDTFKFKPIHRHRNEIRLIELFPGTLGESIRCGSSIWSLDENPKYEALSYAWGDPEIAGTITLCGKTFNVSTNLLSALKNLRYQHTVRVLWIDALCIDQQNIFEREWQVGLMGEIYSKCEVGLLWIGDESEESDTWCTTKDKDCCTYSNNTNNNKDEICSIRYKNDSIQGRGLWEISNEDQLWYPHCRWHGRQPRLSTLLDLVDRLQEGKHLYDIPILQQTLPHLGIPSFGCLEPLIALRSFMNRSWWTRMWTVQEAVLPPVSVLCWGQVSYPFQAMASAAKTLYIHSTTCCSKFFTALVQNLEGLSCGEATVNALFNFQKHLHTLELTRKWIYDPEIKVNLMDCLYNFHDRQSKDSRDKIFALLGLLPKDFRCSPDYQTTTEELYENMSVLLLDSYPDQSLSVLWRESDPELTGSRSSWIKDFDKETKAINRRARGEHYDASDGGFVQLQSCGNGILSLLGTRVDIISELTPHAHVASTYTTDQFSTFRDWAQFLHLYLGPDISYVRGGTWFEAFARTLTGDLHELVPGYTGFRKEDVELFILSLLGDDLEDKLINASLAQEFNTSAAGRKLFVTQNGFIGLGPTWMRPGDEVWVLSGGSVPFVLRPSENQEPEKGCEEDGILSKHRIVVGDCYVHGIMFGEAVGDQSQRQRVFLQ